MDHLSDDVSKELTSPLQSTTSVSPLTSPPLSTSTVSPLSSKNSLEDSVNPASVHALQTAFSSLQKKHNDLAKKFNELQHRNKLMRKALGDMNYHDDLKHMEGMDEAFMTESCMAHAAGAEGDMESMRAEYRAKLGYIQHLEKEVLRNNSAIARGNEEIRRLKRRLDEFEREKMSALKGRDTLHADLQTLAEGLEQSKIENREKDEELNKLRERLETENQSRLALVNDNTILRERLEVYEQSANVEKDTEIQDLKSRLTIADSELRTLNNQFREMEHGLQQRDREVSILEARCRQFEIQVEIGRQNNQKQGESKDEVDGDIAKLTEAVCMIQEQKEVISQLKLQLGEQQALISKMSKRKAQKVDRYPEPAEGQSMHQIEDRYEQPPVYENTQNVLAQRDAVRSEIRQRPNERFDTRMNASFRVSPRGSDTTSPPVAKLSSPRIQDVVKPTGNRNVATMYAAECNQQMKRGLPENVVDSTTTETSRLENLPSAYNAVNRTSPARGDSSQISPLLNIDNSRSRRHEGDSGEYYNTSPRTRQDRPIETPRSVFDGAVIDTGARPRIPSSYLNIQQQEEPNPHAINRIPDRMTKSEIYVSKSHLENSGMTRSVLDPVRPLVIPSQGNNFESSASPLHRRSNSTSRVREPSEHIYMNETEGRNDNHDYENIYNAKDQTEIKQPPNASDILTPVSSPQMRMAPATALNPLALQHANVSTLKICPACNEEFSRLTMDQFQQHVFECFDTCEESQTLHAGGEVNNSEDDRNCPMCGETFPTVIPQETYEQHVLAHFGEEPLLEERFEVLNP